MEGGSHEDTIDFNVPSWLTEDKEQLDRFINEEYEIWRNNWLNDMVIETFEIKNIKNAK